MKRFHVLVLSPLALVVSGCLGQIPVVGLDEEGKVIETMVKKNDYVSRLKASVTDLQDSVIPVLDSEEARGISSLRQTQFGLGLSGEVGIGDHFNLGGNIGFRLVFADN